MNPTAAQNPFRTSQLLNLPAVWGDETPDDLLARWRAAGRRGALVGPHGTGKTTRLRVLAGRLALEGWRIVWVQWHGDGRTTPADWRAELAGAGARTVLCMDGSENAGMVAAYQIGRYAKRAGGLLATRHRRPWLLPVLAEHTPVEKVFAEHAEWLAPGCGQAAREAFAAAKGNAHEAFRRLYLAHAGQAAPSCVSSMDRRSILSRASVW